MENPIKMDDLGVFLLFLETSIPTCYKTVCCLVGCRSRAWPLRVANWLMKV